MSGLRVLICALAFVLAVGRDGLAQQAAADPQNPPTEGAQTVATDAPPAAAEAQPSAAAPATGEAPPGPNVWAALTVGAGLQLQGGDLSAIATSGVFDWIEQFRAFEFEVSLNGLAQFIRQEAVSRVGHLNSVARWVPSDDPGRRLYLLAHAFAQHDASSGIDLLATAAGGVGMQVLNTKNAKFTLEAGLGYSIERQIEDYGFATAVFSPALRWKINERASLMNQSMVYLNLRSGHDVRLHNEIDLIFQFSPRFGLQNQLLSSFDNDPVLGYKQGNVQFTMNLTFSWMQGAVPQ
jgi:hypothetical protein